MNLLRGLTIGTLALAAVGCASSPPSTPTVNVTGNWIGTLTCTDQAKGKNIVVMKLTQTGNKVVGDVQVTGSARLTNSQAEATVDGDQVVLSGIRDISGRFKVTGDTMSGPFQDQLCPGQFIATREPFAGAVTTSRLRTVSMTVQALDVPSRMITLRGPQGGTLTMQVDERVKTLPMISVGDVVTVAYYESWVLSLNKPGEPPSGTVVATSAAGQMPAGFVARRSTVQAKVTAIDAVKPSVTFMGPRESVEVSVAEDPRVLGRVKVGDTYDVTYTENLAVAVDKSTSR